MPLEEEFRVGTMGLGWDADSRTIVVELLAVSEEEIDESVVLDDGDEGPDALRVFLSPIQARAFAERVGMREIDVSLTHSHTVAAATCVADLATPLARRPRP